MYRSISKTYFFVICLFFIVLSPLSAKPNEKEEEPQVYYKYSHPRDYVFDLSDAKDNVILKFDDSTGKLKCNVDFTYLVKDEMPRKGDRITFKYQFVASHNLKNITAYIFDIKKGKNLGNKEPELFSKPTPKKSVYSKEFSIILNDDADLSFVLCLSSATENKKEKISLSFNRIVQSTNIKNELAEEKKAAKKGLKIVPAKMDFGMTGEADVPQYPDAVIEPEEKPAEENVEPVEEVPAEPTVEEPAAEITEVEKEIVEESETISIPEQQNQVEFVITTAKETVVETTEEVKEEIAEVKEEVAEEPQPEQESEKESEQVIPETTLPVQRYEKEFLQDYAVTDEIVLDVSEDDEIEIIENPDEADDNGVTLLMNAAKSGNDWEIKTLIDSKADINLKDKDGWTALMYAVRYQESLSCVDLLLNAQADIKIKNNYDLTALIIAACYNNNPDILNRLLSYYSSSEKEVTKAFVLLLSENHSSEFSQVAKIKIFLDKSIPLNTFYNGKTPLMYAAQYCNSTKILKLLMESNAITTLRSTEGKTAFDYAQENVNLKHDSIYWSLNKK